MKKIIFLCIFLFNSFVFTFANSIFSFEIQPEFGVFHGSISEVVYEDTIKNIDNLESRLDWDIPAIPYFGGAIKVTALKYIYTEAGFYYAVPGDSGFMKDYDWLNSFYFKNDDPTELTNYSQHNNQLDEFYKISFTLGGVIPIIEKLKLIPVVSYDYEFITFTGNDGFGLYKTKNWKRENFSGRVISYKQEINALSFGFQTSFTPVKNLTLNGRFTFSPNITNLVAIDYHYIRSQAFMDKISDAAPLQAKLSIFYNLNKMNSFGILCNFQYIPACKGEDFIRPLDYAGNFIQNTQWSKTSALGGTFRTLWNWTVVYSLNF